MVMNAFLAPTKYVPKILKGDVTTVQHLETIIGAPLPIDLNSQDHTFMVHALFVVDPNGPWEDILNGLNLFGAITITKQDVA